MKKIIIMLMPLFILACSPSKKEESSKNIKTIDVIAKNISGNDIATYNPYFTSDNAGNPVLCWVSGNDESTMLMYSVYADSSKGFGKTIKVKPSKGLSPHHEGMPKVAFKKDGTVIAVYGNSKRVNMPHAMYAGAIFYTQSFDHGQSWTKPTYVHSDTAKGYSRGFVDIATLPDGEVGAVWLDARKRQDNGSTLYFTKTKGETGFIRDMEIAPTVCECCRTDIYVGPHGNVNIAYRDIFGDNIRDMAHLVSEDAGLSFSQAKRISADNWKVDGCPHTGPSMCANQKGLHFFWFTGGNKSGVYQNLTVNHGKDFSERKLLSAQARHPQAIALKNGTLAIVWDEVQKTDTAYHNRICLQLQTPNGERKTYFISPENGNAAYPVLAESNNNQLVLAWTQISDDTKQIRYTTLNPTDL